MTTKQLVVGGCWALAAILCFLIGFDVVNETKYDLVAVSIGLIALGLCIDLIWDSPG